MLRSDRLFEEEEEDDDDPWVWLDGVFRLGGRGGDGCCMDVEPDDVTVDVEKNVDVNRPLSDMDEDDGGGGGGGCCCCCCELLLFKLLFEWLLEWLPPLLLLLLLLLLLPTPELELDPFMPLEFLRLTACFDSLKKFTKLKN